MFTNKARGSARTGARSIRPEQHQVVQINGASFVSNLYWLSLSSATNYMRDARIAGDEAGCDVVAIRRSRRIQAGFVARKSGAVKGMYSTAASLAAILGDSWCGALKLNDGRYVVVVVHEGQIVPGYDLITDPESAVRKLREAIGMFKFRSDSIFAAPELELSPNTKDIYELLNPKALRKDLRLRPLRFGMSRKELALAAAGVATLAAIGIGVHLYRQHRQAQWAADALKHQLAQQAELNRINEDARKKLLAEALAHPWAKQPTAQQLLEACDTASGDDARLSIAGWPLDGWECTATSFVATYKRASGTTDNQFVSEALALTGIAPTLDSSGDVGTLAFPLHVAAAGDDPLSSADQIVNNFRSHFQALNLEGMKPTVSEKEVVLAIPAAPDGTPPDPSLKPPPATWRLFPFTLADSLLPPEKLFEGFAAFDGVRIEKVTASLNATKAQLTWTVEGNLYAKR
ncbi:type 4b pilus protein PilO2 [Burkholderia vietnamiensis]|uniref:type 4b pilus protein PilO2 n=1 Tax=Burkholderia vietnamiensis TaxID=60552 RepID=UPI001593EACF|nr:type 4b pilus protein PilO2 [Burkholderia vietnamiensis]MCA8270703.1 type 4b pilus protein PilO2 [Burkholderia vietnamiensis]